MVSPSKCESCTCISLINAYIFTVGKKITHIVPKKRVVKGGVHDLNTLCPNINGRKITDIFLKK